MTGDEGTSANYIRPVVKRRDWKANTTQLDYYRKFELVNVIQALKNQIHEIHQSYHDGEVWQEYINTNGYASESRHSAAFYAYTIRYCKLCKLIKEVS